MYLFIFANGTIKSVADNITVADMLAVKQKLLKIVRFNLEKKVFQELVIDESKALWLTVKQSYDIICSSGKTHQ